MQTIVNEKGCLLLCLPGSSSMSEGRSRSDPCTPSPNGRERTSFIHNERLRFRTMTKVTSDPFRLKLRTLRLLSEDVGESLLCYALLSSIYTLIPSQYAASVAQHSRHSTKQCNTNSNQLTGDNKYNLVTRLQLILAPAD